MILKQDEALASEVAALILSGTADVHYPPSPSSSSDCQLPVSAVVSSVVAPMSSYDELDKIDQMLTAMEIDLPPRLRGVGRPSFRDDKFPLQEELRRARAMESRIARIVGTSKPLHLRQQQYSQRLQELLKLVMDASLLWKMRADELDPLEPSSVYDSGIILFCFDVKT